MLSFIEILNEGAETAKVIRTLIKKELGLSAKDVSVRKRKGSSSSVQVDVKSEKALMVFDKIKNIGKNEEKFDRDEATQEILSGGNNFVFVDVETKMKREYCKKAQEEYEAVKSKYSEGECIELYKTFDVYLNDAKRGHYRVSFAHGNSDFVIAYNEHGIGDAVVDLIHRSKDFPLYAKIK